MSTGGLRHIALKTRNLKETEKFYTELLGLKVAFRVPPKMIFLRSPGSRDLLNFVESKDKIAGSAGLDHFGFNVSRPELKRLEKRLKENGIAIDGRRGRNAIYICDPNGYQIEYYCD
jgi:catechol-2,3-dioxygenase